MKMEKKKFILGVGMLVLALFIVGCLDYKAYGLPKSSGPTGAAQQDTRSLVDEIAQIERQLQEEEKAQKEAEVVEEVPEGEEVLEEGEEVVLPELSEEAEEVVEAVTETLQTISVKENELVKLNVKVSDPDKDTVSYTFSKPLSRDGQWKTNYGDAGEYVVTITATDGQLTTEKKVKIVVQRVNVPPVIEPVADITVKEGDKVTFQPKVSDPNKDKVTVTVSPPLQDGAWQTDHTSAGEYGIKVLASDGELESEKTFKLTVTDVNVLPEISNLPETLSVKEGDTVQLNPAVSDLDEDPIKITMSEPVGDDGIWKTSFTDHGEYVITVTVSDGKDTVVRKVTIIVADVNMPPEIVDVSLGE